MSAHGKPHFHVVVIHGGPGAGGEMAPVARHLTAGRGVLEPIQTATSLEGQVEELRTILEKHGNIPVTLIGFSWGAQLSFILAAHYPGMIKKLILVGSGSFEEKYVARLYKTRFSRLDKEEKAEFEFIASAMGDAAELRRSGKLLEFGKLIKSPVVAIHGDYDPHPAEGVQKPLSASLESFRFFLLQNCGHMPWIERQARDKFYSILKAELGQDKGNLIIYHAGIKVSAT